MNRLHSLAAIAMLAAIDGAHAGEDSTGLLLNANFNDEPIDQPIGTGGPELGQPISVFPGLSAIVRAAPLATPSLEFSEAVGGTAMAARFEFLGGEEVTHGDLEIHMHVEAAQLDTFQVSVREAGTAAQNFTSVVFTSFGAISVSDRNGSFGTIGTYSSGAVVQLGLFFHMDEGTYDINVDGVSLLSGRSHGVTARGIGAVLLGSGSLTTPGTKYYVDRLRVTRGESIFHDGFD